MGLVTPVTVGTFCFRVATFVCKRVGGLMDRVDSRPKSRRGYITARLRFT